METFNFGQLLLPEYGKSSITRWNRLDSFPRTSDLGRGLKFEVRDAMWMLTRQWQFGEFWAEDAGSPISAKITGLHKTPDKVLVKGKEIQYDTSIPLEAMIEREEIIPTLRLKVQMGWMFFKLLKANNVAGAYSFFISNFPLPDFATDEDIATRLFFQSVAGRVADGHEIYKRSTAGVPGFFNGFPNSNISPEVLKIIEESVLNQFIKWFDQLYFQVQNAGSAWKPERMEYDFQLNVPAGLNQKTSLSSPDYAGGRLDWAAFDLTNISTNLSPGAITKSGEVKSDVFMPGIVSFKGMPNPRLWQMEPGNMDFGKIEKSPAGIVGLLLSEYGLTYSNDWFLLPYPAKINTLCSIEGILVIDVFGQKTFVPPASMASNASWQKFALFNVTKMNAGLSGGQTFYLPPVLGVSQESEPLERIYFMRDEIANLVWAIEDIVPSQTGGGKKILQAKPAVKPPNTDPDKWRYTLGTNVPDHWIPFIAVHKPGSDKEIYFQRARIPAAVPPGGLLLTETQPVYLVEEQEIPCAGIIVERSIQRVRWMDGRTYLWIGRRKMSGRGEGSSGLAFDKMD